VFDEDEVFEMDRSELLSTYAEYFLSPPIPESPEKAEGGVCVDELELKRQELELRKEKLQMQRETRQQELERQEKEEERRQDELERKKGRRDEK